ncbi:hypothetical protein DV515_00017867, partial [Chloebia gouldiae]
MSSAHCSCFTRPKSRVKVDTALTSADTRQALTAGTRQASVAERDAHPCLQHNSSGTDP